jgi:hypothetical protein
VVLEGQIHCDGVRIEQDDDNGSNRGIVAGRWRDDEMEDFYLCILRISDDNYLTFWNRAVFTYALTGVRINCANCAFDPRGYRFVYIQPVSNRGGLKRKGDVAYRFRLNR